MSLTNTNRKVIHNGNASATSFAFTFPILDASHLSVIYTSASGVETTLSSSLYSVTGIGSLTGGSVTYPLTGSPIASGTKLTIVRTVPYTQTTVLSNQGGYYPEVVEQRFDLMYMALQQLAEIVSRYTVSSISDPATEQSNYALIQALQLMGVLTTDGDFLTRTSGAYARLAKGSNAGDVLAMRSGAPTWITPSILLTTHTGSGTHTANANARQLILFTLGGGAGGGGVGTSAASGIASGGGGAGSWSLKVVSAGTFGASQTVTIGAAGSGGATGANNGSAGGDTSIGSLCIGKGGSGGTAVGSYSGQGGAGGVAGTGDITTTGARGDAGVAQAAATNVINIGGKGADSIMGGGGLPPLANTGTAAYAGNNATGYGAGGSGACNNAAGGGTTAAGGNGSAGYAFVIELVR